MSTKPPISSFGSAPLMVLSSPAASTFLIQSRRSLLAIGLPCVSRFREGVCAAGAMLSAHGGRAGADGGEPRCAVAVRYPKPPATATPENEEVCLEDDPASRPCACGRHGRGRRPRLSPRLSRRL